MKSVTVTAAAIALVAIAGAGAATAHPGGGQGRGNDDPGTERQGRGADDGPGARGAGPAAACVGGRRANVGYVFRGTVTAAAADSVTVNLWGGNRHARRALAAATPPVIISRTSTTDLLKVPTPVGTRMTRNGATGAPLAGDQVNVKYRAPHSRWLGTQCVPAAAAVVTVSGTPPVATFGGTGVTLTRVSAFGSVNP